MAGRLACMLAGCLLATGLIAGAGGCVPRGYDPQLAADPYPAARHLTGSRDIQLFRDGPDATIFNATVQPYRNARLWLNQRWVREIPDLEPGGSISISLEGFRDELGEQFVAGGFFRTERTTPIVLAQIEVDSEPTLVGLEVIGPVLEER